MLQAMLKTNYMAGPLNPDFQKKRTGSHIILDLVIVVIDDLLMHAYNNY